MKELIDKLNRLNNFLQIGVQDIVGTEAVKHYKKSFHDEAFSDKGEKDMTWQEVKRRKNEKNAGKADATRKILTGRTGDLGESIDYEKQGHDVAIVSDKVYAQAHNEGLKAGRGKGFTMPKRQFIGHSDLLTQRIFNAISKRITNILK